MPSAPYSSDLAQTLAEGLLERFLRYVQIDTQSDRDANHCPSTPGQLELAKVLVAELDAAGLRDAAVDSNGYVTATLRATGHGEEAGPTAAPVIGLIAHLDTSPDAPGAGVKPLVHRDYQGSVIELPEAGTRLDPARMPQLAAKLGHDIVTGSGDTLLGADDKAGVAEIVTAVAHLAAHPELPRPTLRVGFTPDEEIGFGARLFDVERFGACCAYTLDGSSIGELEDESFNAAEAIVTVRGVDTHPGHAAGAMVSALRLAARIIEALPSDTLTPETTSGREGYIHPSELTGAVGTATLRVFLRDFDQDALEDHITLLRNTAERVVASAPGAQLQIEVRHQYPNMHRYLEAVPQVVAAAEEAMRAEGIEPMRKPIRGGTDGSQLSAMGLPTPNLFTGGHDYHSPREWASVQEMAGAASVIVRLAEVWSRPEMREAAPAPATLRTGR